MDKRSFLYKKPSIIGILDSSDNIFDDVSSWFLDDSRVILERKFQELPIDELIIELVDIFKEGDPSYQELAILFGSYLEVDEEKMIFSISTHKRASQDIDKLEMHVDAQSYKIHHLNLYVREVHPVLQNKLNEVCSDISLQKIKNGFMITVRKSIIIKVEKL